MASISALHLENEHLRFGKVKVPMATANAFWVKSTALNQIEISCTPKGHYHTTYCLHFKNGAKLHECIQFLLSNTQLKPSILSFRNVKPLTVSEYGKGSIRFTFNLSEDLDFFCRYFLPLIPDCIFERGVFENNIYFAQVTFQVVEMEIEQVSRINLVFQKIVGKYQNCGINPALARSGDKRFPPPLAISQEAVPNFTPDQILDYFGDYDIHEDQIYQRIGLPNEQIFVLPVKTEDIHQWIMNPESFKERRKAIYMDLITTALSHELLKNPVNNKLVKSLLNTALSFESFDLKAFMRELETAQADMLPS